MTPPSAPALQSFLETLLPEALSWLKKMVRINSFTENAAGVDRMGQLTAECFAPLGFKAEFVDSNHPRYGRHLFLQRQGQQGPPVLLVTHLDTVYPPEEEQKNHFEWEESESEGRIYGPGTVDIKGGTIVIWMLLQALRHFAPAAFENTHWLIAANASEEVIATDFADETIRRCKGGTRAVLVFEGGPREGKAYHVVIARKGRTEYSIIARGRGAHAGSAHADGVNAIVDLAEVVRSAAALTDYERDLTLNIARIEGGTVLNRVPHEARIELEMRAYDPAVLSAAQRAVEKFAAGNDKKEKRAAIEVTCTGETPAWPPREESEQLVEYWKEAASTLGLQAIPVQRGGLSDANYLYPLGPTLDGLGPCGGNAHCSERTADGSKLPEFVEINSFVPKAAMNTLAIMGVLKNKSAATVKAKSSARK